MPKRWIGAVVSSEKVNLVDAEIPASGPIVIQADHVWPLQKGDRATAYNVMRQRITDYAREQGIAKAIVKGSAVSLSGTRKAHLESAELRGVVLCALAATTTVQVESKGRISKTFGSRKVDQYLRDPSFWGNETTGSLRVASREAAMLLLAARKK